MYKRQVVIPSRKPETLAQSASRLMKTWADEDNPDVDRSVLLLMSKDDGAAYIEAGAGLQQRILPGAA